MKIVTAGNKYLDIDAYASCVAYTVLLRGMKEKAMFVSSAKLNSSVPKIVKNLGFSYRTNYEVQKQDEFILLDLSNPDFFDHIVNKEKVIEVIDHHTGFEKYWKNKIGDCAQIEFIGAAATLVFERFEKLGRLELLNHNLCKLLICAILDNTLNLKASVTTKRDRRAYKKLHKIGKIKKSFDEEYLKACQAKINENLQNAIESYIKMEQVSKLLPKTFAQLTFYDKTQVLPHIAEVAGEMNKNHPNGWIANLICLKDGKSYIYSGGDYKLSLLFGKKASGGKIVLKHFLLRKEIMKIAREKDK